MTDSHDKHDPTHPKNDARSAGELISVVLGGADEDLYWDAINALHWRGTREVLDRAVGLCRSSCAVERRVGADILGQLGVPERAFPESCLRTLLKMLEGECEHEVLRSVLVALSHVGRPEAVAPASRLRHHVDPEVRHGVVLALTGHEGRQALEVLVELTTDPAVHVRDWATFALGSQVDVDTPELRQALVERLADQDDDTRSEALVGLARRGDRRVLKALHKELASDTVGRLAVEAAALIGAPGLHPRLIALQEWWDVDKQALQQAIRVCGPCPGPMN